MPTKQDIQRLLTSVWPRLAKTLTTPELVYDFVLCILTHANIPHECREEGILMFRPIVAMSGEMEFVALVDAPAADPANDDYVAVL